MLVDLISLKRLALAPWPYVSEAARYHIRLPRQHDVRGGHLRSHHADEIVRPEHAIDQSDEGLTRMPASFDADVLDIEEEDEDAIARVGRHLSRLFDGVGLRALGLRARRTDEHMLEGLNGLHGPVLEHLEILSTQVQHRCAMGGRIGIHTDEVRFGLERGGLRILSLRVLRSRSGGLCGSADCAAAIVAMAVASASDVRMRQRTGRPSSAARLMAV